MPSNDLNKVILIGRLTRDAELKYNTKGTAIAAVSLANNRSVKRNDNWETEVSYFDADIFGKTAENLKPYLTKGKMICITAHMKQDRWEKDGQKFSRVKLEAEDVQLLGGNGSEIPNSSTGENMQQNASHATNQANTFQPQTQPAPQAPESAQQEMFSSDDFPEDIPF